MTTSISKCMHVLLYNINLAILRTTKTDPVLKLLYATCKLLYAMHSHCNYSYVHDANLKLASYTFYLLGYVYLAITSIQLSHIMWIYTCINNWVCTPVHACVSAVNYQN